MTERDGRVVIIDYGMGNLLNVQRACHHVGLESIITSDRNVIQQARAMILPGVGAFGDAMNNLVERDLVSAIREHITAGQPFLGVCLGMQLLLSESEEFGGHEGLDVIKGRVIRFPNIGAAGQTIKVPQVGWNRIRYRAGASQEQRAVFAGVPDAAHMYFVHSYYAVVDDPDVAVTLTEYEGVMYCSSLMKGAVFATQFHPEKSGVDGLKVFYNWARKVSALEERGS